MRRFLVRTRERGRTASKAEMKPRMDTDEHGYGGHRFSSNPIRVHPCASVVPSATIARSSLLRLLPLLGVLLPTLSHAAQFRPVAVYVDSDDAALAAYQVEIVADGADIVGVEGGEPAAFRDAPYYDPAALQGGRIIIAAFNTGTDLPRGKTRVATLHMRETSTTPEYEIKFVTAASSGGTPITPTVSVERLQGGTP
jgi:hypothetical protein